MFCIHVLNNVPVMYLYILYSVIRGAKFDMEHCWSDESDGEDKAKTLCWNIKLIDFGFARPLHPDDIGDNYKNKNANKPEPDDSFFGRSSIDSALTDKDIKLKKQDSLSLSSSYSHKRVRGLSAVGHEKYAAPEMLKNMRNFSKNVLSLSSSGSRSKTTKEMKKKKMHEQALGDAVSDYGMTTDAYSVGVTLRYMLTGVPPEESISEFVARKNSMVSKLGRSFRKKIGKDKDKRQKRYKFTSDLPREASKVVMGLTHWKETVRTTVRSARNYEWIKSSFTMKKENANHPTSNDHNAEFDFLKCALERRV